MDFALFGLHYPLVTMDPMYLCINHFNFTKYFNVIYRKYSRTSVLSENAYTLPILCLYCIHIQYMYICLCFQNETNMFS